MVLQQHGLLPGAPVTTELDLSYLSDTVLLLRYYESEGELRRAIACIKKRSGDHERTLRDLRFTPRGLDIGPPMTDFRGVLTGVPIRDPGRS
jgi:circadian clock protein KaiC